MAVLGAACSSGDSGEDAAKPKEEAEKKAEADPALEALGDALDDAGVLSVEAAQRMFAAAVAPLPGVEPLEIPEGRESEFVSPAIRRLAGATPDLPPEVAAEVAKVLEPAEGEDEVEIPPGEAGAETGGGGSTDEAQGRTSSAPTLEDLRAQVAEIRAELESRSGHTLSFPIRVRVVRDRATGGDAVTSEIGSTAGCRITLPQSAVDGDAASLTSTVAHEVWHCFQLDASRAAFYGGPLWVIEGQAEWAGEDYAGGSPSSASRWDTWLVGVDRSLFRRSYDAIGVYAVAAQQGADPWRVMLSMLGQGNLAAVETLFGAAPDAAVQAAAEALVREPTLGAEWESTGPGITGAHGAPTLNVPASGSPVDGALSVGRFATLPLVLSVAEGEVLTVALSGGSGGAIGFPGAGTVTVGSGGSARFCMRDEGCECPGDDAVSAALPEIEPGLGAAAIGAVDAGELSVQAVIESLEDACEKKLVGTWTADVGEILRILTAPYGGAGGASCSGPYVLAFGEDLSFSATIDGECRLADSSGTFTAQFTGTYADTGTEFTVANIAGAGEAVVEIAGQRVPIPLLDGFRQSLSRPTPYTITGDELTFSFTAPDGNRFTFSYTRVR